MLIPIGVFNRSTGSHGSVGNLHIKVGKIAVPLSQGPIISFLPLAAQSSGTAVRSVSGIVESGNLSRRSEDVNKCQELPE